MLEKYLKYLLSQEAEEIYMYPALLRAFVQKTTEAELATYLCEYGSKLYVSDRGMEQVNNYLAMMKRPASKLSFSCFVKGIYMLQPKPKDLVIKTNICNAVLAESLGVLDLYFEGHDCFQLFPKKNELNDVFEIHYSGDYEKYVRSKFSRQEIAEKYLNWLETKIDLYQGDLFYDVETYQMAEKSLGQRSEYTAVMDSNDNIIIPSDGLGVFSAMAILRGINFYSWEPNPIGNKAIELGIITSKEPIYKPDYLYVYMYCVKYYELPLYPGQRFLVIDVPTVEKPGYNANLFVSKSRNDIRYDYVFPFTVMSLMSCHCLDYTSQQVTSVMKVPHQSPVHAQFIVASNRTSLEAAISTGFFSLGYWTVRHSSLDQRDRSKFVSPDKLLAHIKRKTLLLFDRSFPFRVETGSASRIEKNIFKRDYGPGWYFIENAMWYGNNFSPGELRVDYSYDSGYFIFKDSSKPKNIIFVRLESSLQDIYGVPNLKLCLVSVYRVGIITYLTYAPEVKILKKSVLIDDV